MKRNAPVTTERMTIRKIIRVTPTQLKQLEAGAEAAGVELTSYIRELALGHTFRAASVLHVDRKLIARGIGAGEDAGHHLKRLVDLLEIGDDPLYETWAAAEVKLAMVITSFRDALGPPS